jgi:carboxymethylenebutenolidase
MWGWISSLTDDGIQHDFDCGLAAAGVSSDKKIGVLGFCLGARAAFRTMMRLPEQVVAGATWHPSFLADDEPDSPHLTAGNLANPLYLGVGGADEVQSYALHQRFWDAVSPLAHVEVEIFPGADHGFTWPRYDTYHKVASNTCWNKTTALFERALT